MIDLTTLTDAELEALFLEAEKNALLWSELAIGVHADHRAVRWMELAAGYQAEIVRRASEPRSPPRKRRKKPA